MPGNLLNPTQRQCLEALSRDGQVDTLRRLAQIVLLYDDGQPTRQVAQAVGRSPGRVRYWHRQFRDRGMAMFPAVPPEALSAAAHSTSTSKPRTRQTSAVPAPLVPAQPPETLSTPALLDFLKDVRAPGVQPEDAIAEAGRKVLRYHFATMLRHEAGTRRGKNIEALHDMRVATRRLRAAFEVFGEVFKPKVLKTHLKRLRTAGRTLGRVRDLDVSLEKAGHYLQTLPAGEHQGLQPLLDAWKQERQAARSHLVAYLDSPEYREFTEQFFVFLTTPGAGARPIPEALPAAPQVREIMPLLIYTRLAAVRAYAAVLPSATVEQLHALRIECKKLRYTVEFFREVLGPEAKAVINDLKDLQDHLGDLNDAQVATHTLNDFLAAWDARQAALPLAERQNPESVVAYLAYRHAERHRLITTFHDMWQRFERQEFRTNLALAVSVL